MWILNITFSLSYLNFILTVQICTQFDSLHSQHWGIFANRSDTIDISFKTKIFCSCGICSFSTKQFLNLAVNSEILKLIVSSVSDPLGILKYCGGCWDNWNKWNLCFFPRTIKGILSLHMSKNILVFEVFVLRS